MKNFYITIFFALILLISSCADAPAPESNPCDSSVFIPAGTEFSANTVRGTISGTAPEGGISMNGVCDLVLSQ